MNQNTLGQAVFSLPLMVLILDGNSEKGAQVWSDFGHLICSRHYLFISRAVTNLIFFQKVTLPSTYSATYSDLPAN